MKKTMINAAVILASCAAVYCSHDRIEDLADKYIFNKSDVMSETNETEWDDEFISDSEEPYFEEYDEYYTEEEYDEYSSEGEYYYEEETEEECPEWEKEYIQLLDNKCTDKIALINFTEDDIPELVIENDQGDIEIYTYIECYDFECHEIKQAISLASLKSSCYGGMSYLPYHSAYTINYIRDRIECTEVKKDLFSSNTDYIQFPRPIAGGTIPVEPEDEYYEKFSVIKDENSPYSRLSDEWVPIYSVQFYDLSQYDAEEALHNLRNMSEENQTAW